MTMAEHKGVHVIRTADVARFSPLNHLLPLVSSTTAPSIHPTMSKVGQRVPNYSLIKLVILHILERGKVRD